MKKRVILFIDSSQQDTVRVTLEVDLRRYTKISQSRLMKAQTVLPLIEELLHNNHISFSDISEITVHTGPGSFTGLRVGAAIANALGLLLDVPVNGKHGQVTPSY